MKTQKHKAFTFLGAAFVLLIAIFAGCKQPTSTSGGGGAKPIPPAVKKFKVTLEKTVGGNVTVSLALPENGMVSDGTELIFTATALTGYKFTKWELNGTDTGVTEPAYKLKIMKQAQVKAVFVVDNPALITKYTVTLTPLVHGTVTSVPEIPPDNQVPEGTEITFTAKPAEDYLVDKWTVFPESVLQAGGTAGNSTAMVKITDNTTVAVTFKQAPVVIIRFDQSKIEARKTVGDIIYNNDTVYEGNYIFFTAIYLPLGQQVDRWKVNGKELDSSVYKVNAADAIDEGSSKVITVDYTIKTLEAVTIKFDSSTISVNTSSNIIIHDGDTVYEGDKLCFKAYLLPGQQVNKWKVNGKELDSSVYKVNAADAIDEGSSKVITVDYTIKTLEAVTIKFDSSTISVNTSSNIIIHDGDTVYEGDKLCFRAYLLPGQQVDKWKVNTKVLYSNVYEVNAANAVDEGSNKVITVTYMLK